LGHIVSAEGVRIDSIRVEAIQSLSLPRTKKEVQSFLGKNNFLRRFVSKFSELVKHIMTMLRKGNEVKWTIDSRDSFNQIKKALNEAPVLISLDYSNDFLIFSFSSDTVVVVFVKISDPNPVSVSLIFQPKLNAKPSFNTVSAYVPTLFQHMFQHCFSICSNIVSAYVSALFQHMSQHCFSICSSTVSAYVSTLFQHMS
jgi:hypothetical protein